MRQSIYILLAACGYAPHSFAGGDDFLEALPTLDPGCTLLDVRMPGINGLQLLERAKGLLSRHPVVMMTGHGEIAVAVGAMKLGAVDFLEKPFQEETLIATITQAFVRLDAVLGEASERDTALALVARLTAREQDVLRGLLAGLSNKVIAFELGLSARTVEMHRANMMERLAVRSLPDAVKIALAAQMRPHARVGRTG